MSENIKILVVDDNINFCQNVKDILELKDYTVETSYDGFKALEMVEQDDFDLVLMDIKMPVMDGVETFKSIKKIAPDTPVIMMTAYAVEDLIREALREGAFGSLKKPLDFDRLFEHIERTIHKGALILVVDDDSVLCDNLENILTDKGYRVSTANDGKIAVKKAREDDFDIVLIDMKLPSLNGLEVYLAIRDIRPDAVAIIITGYSAGMAEQIEEAIKMSAYICIEKPIDMEGLISLIHEIEVQKAEGIIKKPKK